MNERPPHRPPRLMLGRFVIHQADQPSPNIFVMCGASLASGPWESIEEAEEWCRGANPVLLPPKPVDLSERLRDIGVSLVELELPAAGREPLTGHIRSAMMYVALALEAAEPRQSGP